MKDIVFFNASYFHPSLIFLSEARSCSSGALGALQTKGKLPVLPANIKLGWIWLIITTTATYNTALIIITMNSFIVESQCLEMFCSLSSYVVRSKSMLNSLMTLLSSNSWGQCYKTFFSLSLRLQQNKLQRLSLDFLFILT